MKINVLVVILITLAFCGCTTTPVGVDQSHSVSTDRVYDAYKKYAVEKEAGSKIIIVRDSGILGSAGSAALFVNGEIIARVRAGESITVNVNSGDNILGVGPGAKLNFEKDNAELIEQTLDAKSGATYYFRITIDRYKGLVLQRTTQVK